VAVVASDAVDARAGSDQRSEQARQQVGWLALSVALLAFAAIALPVVINAAPLSDDYHFCARGQEGEVLGQYASEAWADTGIVRPARFLTWFLIAGLCPSVPFSVVVLVPLALKLTTCALLFALLTDLRLPAPWPHLGTAALLLEPLGTEAALWPSAVHVPLGLSIALAALICYRRGYVKTGALLTLGASLSVEQVIFAFPLAAWLASPPQRRRTAAVTAGVVVFSVLVAYAVFPGTNPRQAVGLTNRLLNVVQDPTWFLAFPAVGLGIHSGALALWWSFPFGLGLVVLGAHFGRRAGAVAFTAPAPYRWPLTRGALVGLALLILLNVPLLVTETGQSPRTFTPTWLAVSALIAVGGARWKPRRPQLAGALAGVYAAVAVLSLALSSWVRVETVSFNHASAQWLAEQVEDGDVVAICDVPRTAVDPAPAGSFHLHAWHTEYPGAFHFETGIRAGEWRRSGQQYWGASCPDLRDADVVVSFEDLQRAWRGSP
jgi:hypothetical protein